MERTSPPATTYQETSRRYRMAGDARERFEELVVRDVSARALMALVERGDYDPRTHGDAGGSEPLTVTEHLELLAAGELLARYYRHPAHAHRALQAGASWTPPSTPPRSRALTHRPVFSRCQPLGLDTQA